ncbi:ABC transporter permease [Anaerotruncus colihominis]|uniref:Transport permease protein n=1 Tax=Anaerotruncus colihominis DSM 17241 TaxID=445972 RepID=B0P8V8_9FIRM|nr:ABC transporter permease [Anaerotruncus colihominis]EDS12354.1 ABC-2 type transporter [Anaerotruncus colihominis DSM 17241]UOX64316.1 ABC transporter permease [Anaerotruncus colihominis]UWN74446.1 ABC transporter permease [Anaerotruncus colihominis]
MNTFGTLLKNELRLNIRNMNMVIFAIIMPLMVLVILGFLYGTKPSADGAAYTFLDQSFGALCTISICAGGLMGLPLLVAEYRERKILKRFQVTPVSPVMLLAVEFTIYVIYAALSMLTLLPATRLFGNVTIHGSWLAFFGSWLLTMVSTLSIGMMVGGIAKNEKMASVIACALYFPMLIFSGATLPFEVMPEMMQKIIRVLPMTQGIQLMKETSLGLPAGNVWLPIVVMGAVTVFCTGIAVKCFKWE